MISRKLLLTGVAACVMAAAASPVMAAEPAGSNDVAELKQQITALLNRVEQLEQEKAAAPAASGPSQAEINQKVSSAVQKAMANVAPAAGEGKSNVVTGGDVPGSFKLPGSDTSVKIGGYVKLDGIYRVSGADPSNGQDESDVGSAPLDGTANANLSDFRLHARQSRFNIATFTPSSYGQIKTVVEGDFFGSGGSETFSNSTGFRIRHAYGELGPWLAGQYWSNYMDPNSESEHMDFAYIIGYSSLSQAQVRYTGKLSDSSTLAVSIENPSANDVSEVAVTTDDVSNIPDVVARYSTGGDWGTFALMGVGRSLKVTNTGSNTEESSFGYGLGLGLSLNVAEKDLLTASFNYGDGIGRYLPGSTNAATVNATDLNTITSYGGHVGYKHAWTDTSRSTVSFAYAANDNPVSLTSANKNLYSIHTNVMWDVAPKVTVGAEYMYGKRETEAGQKGDLSRVQFGAYYFF